MLRPSRIIDPTNQTQPYSAWMAGLVFTMLAFGSYGAMQPLLPPETQPVVSAATDEIEIMDFQAPAESAASEEESPPEEASTEPEIPPLPEITPPLTPPEVPELVVAETPPPPPPPQAAPVPKPKKETPPQPKPARRSSSESKSSAGTGDGDAPTVMTGIGTGRFPAPSYPAAARASRQQGTVRLMITVETSGVASSVDVLASSGSQALDRAALDQIRRRWRWPSGTVRRFIAPIRFQIQ